jgi:Fe-S-cluster containining protein
MSRAERRRQSKEDEKLLVGGINPERPSDPEPTAAMARRLGALFEGAKRDGSIDQPIRFLHSKVDASLGGLKDMPIACGKGCSHCCHIWVSVTAPEALFIAKALRRRSDAAAVIERVKAAHLYTKDFPFEVRDRYPHACPLLVDDLCSVYEIRPTACRLAASADAAICERSYLQLANENIPTPVEHIVARSYYAIALAVALKHSQLPYEAFELNGALNRALEREDAERAWLVGEDVFAGLLRDPTDPFSSPQANNLYAYAFGNDDPR